MSTPTMTETVILHVRPGTNLNNTSDPLYAKFVEVLELTKKQSGMGAQYYGHMIEDPLIFVWTMYWDSMDSIMKFLSSPDYAPFLALAGEVFDVASEGKGQLMLITNWTSSAALALKAPVTELGLLTLPIGWGASERSVIESALAPLHEDVITFGKALGAALGFVSMQNPPTHSAAPEGQVVALHGAYGWSSLAAHEEWRKHPEHTKVMQTIGGLRESIGVGMASVSGMPFFHVEFREFV